MTVSTDRRGEMVALMGGGVCLAAAGLAFGLAAWTESLVLWAAGFQIAGVIGIWFLVWIQLHQARLVAEEGLEVAELERQREEKLGGARTIFDDEDLDQMDRLVMAWLGAMPTGTVFDGRDLPCLAVRKTTPY